MLPKSENSVTLDKFHPIMLGDFLLKIISKVLVDRLASISNKDLLCDQFGFIRRMNI